MSPSKTLPLDKIAVFDRDAYQRADIHWLATAETVIRRFGIRAKVLNSAPGLARFLNLAAWKPSGEIEYLDRPLIHGDQLIHAAWHQCIHQKFGSDYVGFRLLGETLASASDLYLLGCLADAGEEGDFVLDTLESYNFYYETYGDLADLENLLAQIMADPYAQMLSLAHYLYRFVAHLVFETPLKAIEAGLHELAQDSHYPLVHHYHLPNWVVTLGNHHECKPDLDRTIADFWNNLAAGPSRFDELAEAIVS